ncbi:MAG: hypothetical protein LBD50_03165 [Rickettsiales bacterium]|nr:hypothetical protein [Rickettsiales bacterium]
MFFLIIPFNSADADIAGKTYVDSIIGSLESTSHKITSVAGGGAGISASATDAQYPSAKAVQEKLNEKVSMTGAETIAGVKTFSSIPMIPTASLPVATP